MAVNHKNYVVSPQHPGKANDLRNSLSLVNVTARFSELSAGSRFDMASSPRIRAIAAAAVSAFGVVSSATATPTLYYATNIATPEALGTIASGGVNLSGGLCSLNTAGCISGAAAPLTNGLVALTATPSVGIANYLLTVNIFGNGTASYGSIWDVTLVNGGVGTSLGLTKIVSLGTEGSGTIRAVLSGTGSFDIGVTNLLEQYYNKTDMLPGFLTGNPSDTLDGGTVSNATSGFTLTYSLTPAPEPVCLVLFIGALATIGALRLSTRAVSANP